MGLFAPKKEYEYELIPAGNYLGICYAVVDLGYHENEYQGEVKIQRKIRISFETPRCRMKEGDNEGRPFSVTAEVTLSLAPNSKLYGYVRNWLGRELTEDEKAGFDFFSLLGKPAMVNVIHETSKKGNIFPRIGAINQVEKGTKVPQPENELLAFSLDEDSYPAVYETLPDWLKDKINLDYQGPVGVVDEDVPDEIFDEQAKENIDKAIEEEKQNKLAFLDDDTEGTPMF